MRTGAVSPRSSNRPWGRSTHNCKAKRRRFSSPRHCVASRLSASDRVQWRASSSSPGSSGSSTPLQRRGGGHSAALTHSSPSSTSTARSSVEGRVYIAVVSSDSWPSNAASSTSLPGWRRRKRRANEYVGSIVDWYAATLMRREPMLQFEGSDQGAKSFYNLLSDDCDLKGTNLHEFFRQCFVQVMVLGSSFVVVDFPKAGAVAQTRAEEDASGRSRAYLTQYAADEVINWNYDDKSRSEERRV